MVGSERREPDVLAEGLRDRRPVIGKGDPGLARPVRREVVAPGPAAEAQAAVADVVARLPGDGAGRVEHLHPVGHLVGPVRVVSWYMAMRKICPAAVNGWLSRGSRTRPVPSIAACWAGSASTAKMTSAGHQ